MNTDLLLTSNLKYFIVLYQMRSYAKAAKAIPMTYQGLKKAIHALERELDVLLFIDDQENGLLLTPQADELYEKARGWMMEATELTQNFSRADARPRRLIQIGASEGIPGYFGLDFLNDFERDNPELAISFSEYPDLIIDNALKGGEFNLALTVSPYNEKFNTKELDTIPYHAWINSQNPLSQKAHLEPEDFRGSTVITRDGRIKALDSFSQSFKELDINPQIIRCHEVIWILVCVLEDRGIGLTIDYHARSLASVSNIKVVSVEGIIEPWSFGLSCRKDYLPTSDERVVIDYLFEAARREKAKRANEEMLT